jgi:hypothetical protein
MPTVIVTPPSVVQVRNGVATNPQVTALDYGGPYNKYQLKFASDLHMADAQNGGTITYNADTGIFYVIAVTSMDNGFF